MQTLSLMRHGQTEYNVQHILQGRCDSPLTSEGTAQARRTAAWLREHAEHVELTCTSPLGRAAATLEVVREEYRAAGEKDLPPAEALDGLMERSYGPFEGGPVEDVPAELWDPGEKLVPYGGEGSVELRERVVATMTDIMEAPGVECALAVCHGSATLQFKLAWERLARCPQDVHLGNCCVLVFDYDPAARTFACEKIVNQGI